jgi:hypothetical protein
VPIVRRPWHLLDATVLRSAIHQSQLCRPDIWNNLTVDELAQLYDQQCLSVLDAAVPARVVLCRRRASDPWFDRECRDMKREVRRLERKSLSDDTAGAGAAWRTKRREYRQLRQGKRQTFWQNKVDAEKSSPRQLWRLVDALLGRGRVQLHDEFSADQFHEFFDKKVANVRSTTASAPIPSLTEAPVGASFSCFESVRVDEVVKAVRELPHKSCALVGQLSVGQCVDRSPQLPW